MSSIADCRVIDLGKISSDKGSLTYAETDYNLPFEVKRVYYTYDIPAGAERGGHSHIDQHELVIAASGSFKITLNDGKKKQTVFLNNPQKGLHIAPGIWRELIDFSTGSVVLVLASDIYLEEDYIRDFNDFIKNK